MKTRDKQHIKELQENYLRKKICGHGGCMSYNYLTGRVTTDYIGNKNKLQLFFINLHLWFIWK